MFKTSFCTGRLCYRDVILVCFATGVKLLVSESEASYGRSSVADEAPEDHAFSHDLKDDTFNEGPSHGKACMASNLFRVFSK